MQAENTSQGSNFRENIGMIAVASIFVLVGFGIQTALYWHVAMPLYYSVPSIVAFVSLALYLVVGALYNKYTKGNNKLNSEISKVLWVNSFAFGLAVLFASVIGLSVYLIMPILGFEVWAGAVFAGICGLVALAGAYGAHLPRIYMPQWYVLFSSSYERYLIYLLGMSKQELNDAGYDDAYLKKEGAGKGGYLSYVQKRDKKAEEIKEQNSKKNPSGSGVSKWFAYWFDHRKHPQDFLLLPILLVLAIVDGVLSLIKGLFSTIAAGIKALAKMFPRASFFLFCTLASSAVILLLVNALGQGGAAVSAWENLHQGVMSAGLYNTTLVIAVIVLAITFGVLYMSPAIAKLHNKLGPSKAEESVSKSDPSFFKSIFGSVSRVFAAVNPFANGLTICAYGAAAGGSTFVTLGLISGADFAPYLGFYAVLSFAAGLIASAVLTSPRVIKHVGMFGASERQFKYSGGPTFNEHWTNLWSIFPEGVQNFMKYGAADGVSDSLNKSLLGGAPKQNKTNSILYRICQWLAFLVTLPLWILPLLIMKIFGSTYQANLKRFNGSKLISALLAPIMLLGDSEFYVQVFNLATSACAAYFGYEAGHIICAHLLNITDPSLVLIVCSFVMISTLICSWALFMGTTRNVIESWFKFIAEGLAGQIFLTTTSMENLEKACKEHLTEFADNSSCGRSDPFDSKSNFKKFARFQYLNAPDLDLSSKNAVEDMVGRYRELTEADLSHSRMKILENYWSRLWKGVKGQFEKHPVIATITYLFSGIAIVATVAQMNLYFYDVGVGAGLSNELTIAIVVMASFVFLALFLSVGDEINKCLTTVFVEPSESTPKASRSSGSPVTSTRYNPPLANPALEMTTNGSESI